MTPYEALSNPAVAMGLEQFAALRMLRLWHWQQVVMRRRFANGERLTQRYRDMENSAADQHLAFVQTLNNFFPAGDTAERDAADLGKGSGLARTV